MSILQFDSDSIDGVQIKVVGVGGGGGNAVNRMQPCAGFRRLPY